MNAAITVAACIVWAVAYIGLAVWLTAIQEAKQDGLVAFDDTWKVRRQRRQSRMKPQCKSNQ